MNLAIIIGVSKYNQPGNDLPGCSNDIKLMKLLLEQTGKYNEILDLTSDTSSYTVKNQLANFAKNHQGKQIEELFFYFTGHGGLFGDNFHFLLSDYDKSRKEVTTLSNDEFDEMLRSLQANLTIKVVDACHAGVSYVKDPDTLAKHLNLSKQKFQDCYFMFSSQSDQSSYQDSLLSAFTEAFVNGSLSFPDGDVRYKDVIDFISDSFASNKDQKPLFVVQGAFTEIAFRIDQRIRDAIASGTASFFTPAQSVKVTPVMSSEIGPEEKDEKKELSLSAMVQAQAALYCTQQEVQGYLKALRENFDSAQFSGELAKLYGISSIYSLAEWETYFVDNRAALGQWLKDNQNDYFANPTYTTHEYEEELPVIGLTILAKHEHRIKIKKNRILYTGFNLTAKVPFKEGKIIARPKYENLPIIVCVWMFIFSKKEMVLFYCLQKGIESDWGEISKIVEPNWRVSKFMIKPDLDASKTANHLVNEIQEFAEQIVFKTLGLENDNSKS